MNQSTTGCGNIFSTSSSSSSHPSDCSLGYSRSTQGSDSQGSSAGHTSGNRTHPAVIVSPGGQQQHQTAIFGDLPSPFDAAAFYGAAGPYTATGQPYFSGDPSGNSPMLQATNFLQPYYGLSPTALSDFNMLQMCCQPLFSEIASPGSEVSPTADSLYGFANRLHPITPTGPHAHQFAMPQSYPQNRNGYMSNTVARPTSAQGKRGGRRPKECEEYVRSDHVALSEEEKDKRDKRRLRNKEAAARCRQRRLDLMGSLQSQVDQLREENKAKDSKIAELQLLKHELITVIREHQCVLPESLRQSLDIDMSSAQQYMPRATAQTMGNDMPQFSNPQPQPSLLNNRKRPASELIPDLGQQPNQPMHSHPSSMPLNSNNNQANLMNKPPIVHIKQEPSFKQEPTLYDVNGRGEDEEMKRPTSLSFSESSIVTSANYLSSSGVSITTPSNLLGPGATDFGPVNLLDAPTGLTPCHPPQATAFPLSSMTTPLGEGRNFETL